MASNGKMKKIKKINVLRNWVKVFDFDLQRFVYVLNDELKNAQQVGVTQDGAHIPVWQDTAGHHYMLYKDMPQ